MFIVDITLKNVPVTLSVQRNSAEDAEVTYQQVRDAINSGTPKILELTCDKQPGKKIGVLTSEISAVQVADKSGAATSSGRPPGFFAMLNNE